MNVRNVPHVVTACCVLHNICEMFNDSIPELWFHADMDIDQPPTAVTREDTTDETNATTIRNTLINYYST